MAVAVPDIGGAEGVDVIDVCVKAGDEVKEGDSLIVLESDKASMEIPSPASGKVISLSIKVGDKASQGTAILQLAVAGVAAAAPAAAAPAPAATPTRSPPFRQQLWRPRLHGAPARLLRRPFRAHAGPSIRG